ncbi:MAG: OsmC family peroxiredoxin [Anaerolineae bacterium]|nr:MAG: OsmC family peroxiredoxin [Anaerolineae bacterium]
MDGSGEAGLSPMELLLASVAGCSGVDVASILRKKRQPLDGFDVHVRGERAPDHPRVYTHIEVFYELRGEGLDPKAVEQALTLSKTKYCSVSAMLGTTTKMTWRYRILPQDIRGEINIET